MEENTQGIPQIRTMPMPPIQAPSNRKNKIIIISILILALLAVGFSMYWFYFRKTTITEQDKLNILDSLKKSSTIDFTPAAKNQILNTLSAQSSTATNLPEDQKLGILNSLGGQK